LNGRIHHEDASPEERIAGVAKSLCEQFDREHPRRDPDYADFRDVLRPYIRKEILQAQIAEARASSALTARIRQLESELASLRFPGDFDLKGPNLKP
jgi:hypothetical protein